MTVFSFVFAFLMLLPAVTTSQATEVLTWGLIGIAGLIVLMLIILLTGATSALAIFAIKVVREVLLYPADRALAPFGMTSTGRSIYTMLLQLKPLADDPGDKVPKLLASTFGKTPEQWAKVLSVGLRDLAGLFDGVAVAADSNNLTEAIPPQETVNPDGTFAKVASPPRPGAQA